MPILTSAYRSLWARFTKSEHTFIITVAILIGALSGAGAICLRFMIMFFQWLSYGEWHYSIEHVRALPLAMKIGIPAAGGLVVGFIVYYFAKEAKGHGVPEVMEAIVLRGGLIRPRVVIAKALASAISIGTGGSVGREGPIVQIGSALGSTVSQFFKLPSNYTRTLVGCGAAAGIAAAFNAPIAGSLFAVEIILGEFGVLQFSPIVISSVIATVISRYYYGDFPAFEVPEYHLVSPIELVFYLGLGILTGFVALLYIKVLYRLEDFFDGLRIPGASKPFIGGLIIGGISIFVPEILGVGYETINAALTGQLLTTTLFLLIFIKVLATSITLGSGASGGIFAPSLFIGAMAGGFMGSVVHTLFPEVTATAGAYATVGMGGIVAAATHGPITAIIMIFELTGDYKIIVPLMMTCIISTLIVANFSEGSIYTLKLLRKKINIFRGKEVNVLRSLQVRDVMTEDGDYIPSHMPLDQLLQKTMSSRHSVFFVVNEQSELMGIINAEDIKFALFEKDSLGPVLIAEDLVSMEPVTVTPEENLDTVLSLFTRYNLDEIPVVKHRNSRELTGVVTHYEVSKAYNREVLKRDIVEGVGSKITELGDYDSHEIASGYLIALVNPPFRFYWKSIRELNVRAAYGVDIILIQRPSLVDTEHRKAAEGSEIIKMVPHPDDTIYPGDKLLIVGPQEKIESLKHL